jgi:glycosyltransferase involved in cell wall biosynthesis
LKNIISEEIKAVIVIPAYNNSYTLRNVVKESIKTGLKVLIIDDGSTDDSLKTVKGLDTAVITFPKNRGKGAAIKAGAAWAEENNFTHIITLDADGQHNPQDAYKFIEKINENPLSIVIGNRDFENSDVPEKSKFGRKFSNFWVKVLTGVSAVDSQSGFRAYPVELIQKIKCSGNRYNFEVEIIVKGIWAGLKIQNVAIPVVYSETTKKSSHFRPFVDNARISLTYSGLFIRNLLPITNKVLIPHEKQKEPFFKRISAFFKMLLKENLKPYQIVLACMLGIFLGTLPLIAIHSIVIIFSAKLLKLNRLIAFNISHFCGPPFVPALCMVAGHYIRSGEMLMLNHDTLSNFGTNLGIYFIDYLVGSIVMAPILAVLVGIVVYIIVAVVQKIRKKSFTG